LNNDTIVFLELLYRKIELNTVCINELSFSFLLLWKSVSYRAW